MTIQERKAERQSKIRNLKAMFKSPRYSADCTALPYGKAVGVEIEFLVKPGNEEFRLPDDVDGAATLKGDGSVHGDGRTLVAGYNGQEIALAFHADRPARLRRICKLLAGKAGVNRTCGLHVHLDARGMTLDEAKARARRLGATLPWLVQMVPASRRSNTYCEQGVSFVDRYRMINGTAFSEHRTIEVRLHSGSIDFDKIMTWVKLLRFLFYAPAGTKMIRSWDDLAESTVPDDVYEWTRQRRNKFSPAPVAPGMTEEASEI